jgi:MoaA/NifB/PqqE/SkfB family radical SAM enzyme
VGPVASETFCVLPWVHAATLTDGSVQLCCVSGGGSGVNLNEHTLADYWNSEYVRDARRRMLAGQKVNVCRKCYREEAYGRRSHRMVENDTWLRRLGEGTISELVDGTAAEGGLDAPLRYVDLRLGNTCNMQCVMCKPRESSRWLPLAKRLSDISSDPELAAEWGSKAGIDRRKFEWYRNPDVWSELKSFLPDVREIILAGGEPLLIREQFDFLKACVEMGEAEHIALQYHTNATVFPEEMIPYWEKFDHVHFMLSIDGMGDVANYVRYPSDWEQIVANIRRFDGLGCNTLTTFHATIHALNVFRLPELLEWADTSGLQNRDRVGGIQELVGTGFVHYPDYQEIRVLPPEFKAVVTRKLTRYIDGRPAGEPVDQLATVLTFMNSEDRSERMPKLVQYTRSLDRIRGGNVLDTFPELAPYWAPYAARAVLDEWLTRRSQPT